MLTAAAPTTTTPTVLEYIHCVPHDSPPSHANVGRMRMRPLIGAGALFAQAALKQSRRRPLVAWQACQGACFVSALVHVVVVVALALFLFLFGLLAVRAASQ